MFFSLFTVSFYPTNGREKQPRTINFTGSCLSFQPDTIDSMGAIRAA